MFVHRMQCAASANGCQSSLVWESGSSLLGTEDLHLMELNGWHLQFGRWVCGLHERAR